MSVYVDLMNYPHVQRTIQFLHESATSVHGNVRLSNIYTSEAGEWKLSGLEVLTNLKEDETAIFVLDSRQSFLI